MLFGCKEHTKWHTGPLIEPKWPYSACTRCFQRTNVDKTSVPANFYFMVDPSLNQNSYSMWIPQFWSLKPKSHFRTNKVSLSNSTFKGYYTYLRKIQLFHQIKICLIAGAVFSAIHEVQFSRDTFYCSLLLSVQVKWSKMLFKGIILNQMFFCSSCILPFSLGCIF